MIGIQFDIISKKKDDYGRLVYKITGDRSFSSHTPWRVRKADWLAGDMQKPEYDYINIKLRELKDFVNIEVNSKFWNLTGPQLKSLIDSRVNEIPSEVIADTISSVVEKYTNRCEQRGYGHHTIHRMMAVVKEIRKFRDPLINQITKHDMKYFFDGFITYLLTRNMANSNVIQMVNIINTSLRFYDIDLAISVRQIFPLKQFNYSNVIRPYFTTEEVMLLYNHKCRKTEREVLDTLVFCAFTGLRYSEMCYVTAESIKNRGEYNVLERYSPKENNVNIVPLNKICMDILDKYRYIDHNVRINGKPMNTLIPVHSNKQCNYYLKKAMEYLAGPFYQNFRYVRHSGSKAEEIIKPRWKVLSWHSARHHYAFWLREKGVPITDISCLLNHKSLTTTMRVYKHEDFNTVADKTYQLIK